MSELITEEELLGALKTPKRALVRKWLDANGIPYRVYGSQKRIITTRTAFNDILMGSKSPEEITFTF